MSPAGTGPETPPAASVDDPAGGAGGIRPFVTSETLPVYCLRNLPEEVVAVLFAYYSRSRESLRDNLLKLIREGDLDLGGVAGMEDEGFLAEAREKARAFHEKWVVGYGHSSVAEHAMVHVAVEDVSILCSKVIEDARLASYTEKSTRYVPFDSRRFHTPDAFSRPPLDAVYRSGIEALMSTYERLMEPLTAHFLAVHPVAEKQTERGRQTACRAQACDVLRYLLPAATLTNLGMTINARALEALLVKMLSSPLAEARRYGGLIKQEALKVVPTLIKYAERSGYRAETDQAMRLAAGHLPPPDAEQAGAGAAGQRLTGPPPRARLIRYDPDAEIRILEAILYPSSGRPADEGGRTILSLSEEQRQGIIEDYLSRRGRHDQPLRAFEQAWYTFEITVDYGAYRDIQRHRMAGQFPQRLGVDLGYERPEALDAAGMAADFDLAMDRAREVHAGLAREHPEEAQYAVPLAYRKRMLMNMNLRELYHFIQLRSARQGHLSYRRVAREMYEELARVHPGLARGVRVDTVEYGLSRG